MNYTRVYTHTGVVYCAFYVCVCVISFYIPNYCSLISKTHQNNHQSAYWVTSAYPHFHWGFAPNQKSMWNKWKNHEMKGDVGMSCHEKEGEQEDTETGNH